MPIPTCSLRQSLAFLRDPAGFLSGPGLELGDLYRVRIPGHRLHIVTSPELVERILVRDASSFVKGRIYWRELQRAIGDALGTLDGDRWQYLHGVQRPFFTPKAVREYLPAIDRLGRRCMDDVARTGSDPDGLPVLQTLSELNARTMLSVLFGQDDGPLPEGLAQRISDGNRILEQNSKFPWRPATSWLDGTHQRAADHQRFFTEYVERLRHSCMASDAENLLRALARIEEDPVAPPFSPSLVRNEVMFHLGASMETTAAAEGWALYLLWRHPATLERLRSELDRVAGDGLVSWSHLDALPYAMQVVRESLRLYPPVYAVVRDAVDRLDLGIIATRPGDTYLINIHGMHRSPRLWDAAGMFQPERFAPHGAPPISRYQYLPFGAGRHACIGRHLALPAMALTVAQFAQRFDWSFSDAVVTPQARPSLKPSGPFRANFSPRVAGSASREAVNLREPGELA